MGQSPSNGTNIPLFKSWKQIIDLLYEEFEEDKYRSSRSWAHLCIFKHTVKDSADSGADWRNHIEGNRN